MRIASFHQFIESDSKSFHETFIVFRELLYMMWWCLWWELSLSFWVSPFVAISFYVFTWLFLCFSLVLSDSTYSIYIYIHIDRSFQFVRLFLCFSLLVIVSILVSSLPLTTRNSILSIWLLIFMAAPQDVTESESNYDVIVQSEKGKWMSEKNIYTIKKRYV